MTIEVKPAPGFAVYERAGGAIQPIIPPVIFDDGQSHLLACAREGQEPSPIAFATNVKGHAEGRGGEVNGQKVKPGAALTLRNVVFEGS